MTPRERDTVFKLMTYAEDRHRRQVRTRVTGDSLHYVWTVCGPVGDTSARLIFPIEDLRRMAEDSSAARELLKFVD